MYLTYNEWILESHPKLIPESFQGHSWIIPGPLQGHSGIIPDSAIHWTLSSILHTTGKVMIIGGNRNETEQSVVTYDPAAKKFDHSLPSLNEERIGLGCAVFKSILHDNREVVLAVGGYGLATAEVYDYTQSNATWTMSIFLSSNI